MTKTAAMPALALSGSNLTGDVPFSCALRLPTGVFVARSPAGSRGDLATLVAELCREHSIAPADVRELRIDLGPGSYTGLRVAVTFARFLQKFGDLPVLACDSLLLLASVHMPTPAPFRVRPLLDARRDRFHVATVVHDSAGLRHVTEPVAIPLEAVLTGLLPGDRIVTSAAVAAQIEARARAAGAAISTIGPLDAGSLFAANLPLQRRSTSELEPRYMMGTYAEA